MLTTKCRSPFSIIKNYLSPIFKNQKKNTCLPLSKTKKVYAPFFKTRKSVSSLWRTQPGYPVYMLLHDTSFYFFVAQFFCVAQFLAWYEVNGYIFPLCRVRREGTDFLCHDKGVQTFRL